MAQTLRKQPPIFYTPVSGLLLKDTCYSSYDISAPPLTKIVKDQYFHTQDSMANECHGTQTTLFGNSAWVTETTSLLAFSWYFCPSYLVVHIIYGNPGACYGHRESLAGRFLWLAAILHVTSGSTGTPHPPIQFRQLWINGTVKLSVFMSMLMVSLFTFISNTMSVY